MNRPNNNQMSPPAIKITAEPTTTPSICKFHLEHPLIEGRIHCTSIEKAQGSLLLEKLFAIEEIREIFVSYETVTIATREEKPDWRILAKRVGETLRQEILSGHELFPADFLAKLSATATPSQQVHGHHHGHSHDHDHDHSHSHAHSHSESANYPAPDSPQLQTPLALEIKALLQEQINPAVASHGGRISLVDLKEGDVYLRMEGGCQGCGQASFTLRQGVEKTIKEQIPAVQNVIDITDHQSGANPYFDKDK